MTSFDRPNSDPPADEKLWVLDALQEAERTFRQRYPLIWGATLLGPIALTALVLAAVTVVAGGETAWKLVATAIATFFVFGRFVILGGSDSGAGDVDVAKFFTSGQLFAMVTYMDLMIASFVAFHIGILFRLPLLGPRIRELVADGQLILMQHRWIKRATFLGLVAFVTFPLSATGSVGGSIFGRLLGMGRFATSLGILLGSLLGNGIMYLGSDLINRYLDKDHPVVKFGGIILILAIIVFLELRYRKMKRDTQALLSRESEAKDPSPSPVESTSARD
ncbi:MAG: small multi-drug export protein [Planctomycetaceae bacterium]